MHLSTKIVGARHRGGEALDVAIALEPGEELTLVRDPSNQYDANAIQVHYDGIFIGFVPKTANADLATALDAGRAFTCVSSGHAQYHEPTIEIDEVDQAPTPA
jgi:hypothetical protein